MVSIICGSVFEFKMGEFPFSMVHVDLSFCQDHNDDYRRVWSEEDSSQRHYPTWNLIEITLFFLNPKND